jgi:broad specificity phosphatase PhoE
VATLYLIRHAEPQIQGVLLGRLDPPLSAAGCRHAEEALSGIEVKVAYCSPLLRARQTAAFLRGARRVEMAALREVDFGQWTGRTWAEVEQEWPALAAQKCADWLGVSPPCGESWQEVLDRVKPICQAIRNGETPVAVVAHQGVNAALASLLDNRNPLEFAQLYGEVIRVEYS